MSTAYLILSVPVDGAAEKDPIDELTALVGSSSSSMLGGGKLAEAKELKFPEFKTGTLASLLSLSDSLVKHDSSLTSSVGKMVEALRSLLSSSPTSTSSDLASHLVLDDGRPYTDAAWPFKWDYSRWRTESRALTDIVDALVKEANSVENAQRALSQQYALVKGSLTSGQRKKTGNLSVRSLADVVSAQDFASTADSEYLDTVLVAVPKSSVKDWEASYERLAGMVVPRSSTKLAADDEFVLFSVTLFKRVRDEFSQKAREQKFIVRDFTFNEEEIEKNKSDLAALGVQEKELWNDLLRLTRLSFSELFQLLLHIKVIRAFTESVLRYGLPANYFLSVIKPEGKALPKLLAALNEHYTALAPATRKMQKKKGSKDDETVVGEYASVLEGEYSAFVSVEVETVV